MMSQTKRARTHYDIQATIASLPSHVYVVEDQEENGRARKKHHHHGGSGRAQFSYAQHMNNDSDNDRPIDYSNHNSSASSSDTECNIVEVSPDQLLYDAVHGSPGQNSDLDENELSIAENSLQNSSDGGTQENVALNKNQIVTLTTTLCHKIRKLAKYELVTQTGNGNGSGSSLNNNNGMEDMIPIPTPILDLNALDAYTAFQLSKNYIMQQPEFEAVPEIGSAIATLENVHHYEIQSKYGPGAGHQSNEARSTFTGAQNLDANLGYNPAVAAAAGSAHSSENGHDHGHGLLQSQHQLRRLTERHFPALIPPTAANPKPRKRCYVCLHSTKRNKAPKRTDTYYMCVECNKPLCAVPCFHEYHTQLSF